MGSDTITTNSTTNSDSISVSGNDLDDIRQALDE